MIKIFLRYILIHTLAILTITSCAKSADDNSPATPNQNQNATKIENPNSTLPSPNRFVQNPLKMIIEGAFIMDQPRYLLAKKNGDSVKIYFVRDDFADGREYLLCSKNLSDLGLKETVGRITIPTAVGNYNIPSNNADVNVNLNQNLAYQGFTGNIQIDSTNDGQISGTLDLKATGHNGDSSWSGNFQAMICSEVESFFKSKNLYFSRRRMTLKSNSESVPGELKVVSDNSYGGGGSLSVQFYPDKVPGQNYYPSGFHFETLVGLYGGRMLNQRGKSVGEYSANKLFYSTENGAYSSLVSPFDLEIDYTDVNKLKIMFITPKDKYEVIF